MNLSEMIVLVRAQADTDEQDAPDNLLEMYARYAYNDIKNRVYGASRRLASTATLSTVANQASYTLSALTSSDTTKYIVNMRGETQSPQYMSWTAYQELLEGNDITYTTREATHFTIRGERIYLWPTPSTTGVSYSLNTYRAYADWPVDSSSNTDLPTEFDELIIYYMLSKHYMYQEDLDLAQMYEGMYEIGVGRQIAAMLRTADQAARPKILGKPSGSIIGYDDWIRRNTEG